MAAVNNKYGDDRNLWGVFLVETNKLVIGKKVMSCKGQGSNKICSGLFLIGLSLMGTKMGLQNKCKYR